MPPTVVMEAVAAVPAIGLIVKLKVPSSPLVTLFIVSDPNRALVMTAVPTPPFGTLANVIKFVTQPGTGHSIIPYDPGVT